MAPMITSSQKAAAALRRAEQTLRNWQDDVDSPRADVDRMLAVLNDLAQWAQAHVLLDIEKVELSMHGNAGQLHPY